MKKLKFDLKFPFTDPATKITYSGFEFDIPTVQDMIHAEEASKGKNEHHYNATLWSLTSAGINPGIFLNLKQPDYIALVKESSHFFLTGEMPPKSDVQPYTLHGPPTQA